MIHAAEQTMRASFNPIPPLQAVEPLTAGTYLALRRIAAGLSIAQVAEALESRAAHRPAIAEQLRLAERPGAIITDRAAVFRLRNVVPFDIGVYQQLAHDAPNRHPRICRVCAGAGAHPCSCPGGAW